MAGIITNFKAKDVGIGITRVARYFICIWVAGSNNSVSCTSVRSNEDNGFAGDGHRSSISSYVREPYCLIYDSFTHIWLIRRIRVKEEARRRKPLFHVVVDFRRNAIFVFTFRIKGFVFIFETSFVVVSCTGCHCSLAVDKH